MGQDREQVLSTEKPRPVATSDGPAGYGARSSFANIGISGRLRKVGPIATAFRQKNALQKQMERLLDIGAGAGVIGEAVATELGLTCFQVDAQDQRIARTSPFTLALGECLPFKDDAFDLVIANHVIEHVGDQLVFLSEVHRVLKPGGYCYLATPSKYAFIEPHYKLPCLSWLPSSAADLMVRLTRKGQAYDVQPLTRDELERLSKQSGLLTCELTEDLIKQPRLYGRVSASAKLASLVPRWVVTLLLAVVPTHVWVLLKPDPRGAV